MGSSEIVPGLSSLNDSDLFDITTFGQVLEMDDDPDEREFSRSIVYDFFEQAEGTFEKMDEALDKRDLDALSSLGHFLKGSSATLGLTKVKDQCEKIQHLGNRKDEAGNNPEPDDDVTLQKIRAVVAIAREEFEKSKDLLIVFYEG